MSESERKEIDWQGAYDDAIKLLALVIVGIHDNNIDPQKIISGLEALKNKLRLERDRVIYESGVVTGKLEQLAEIQKSARSKRSREAARKIPVDVRIRRAQAGVMGRERKRRECQPTE